MIAEKATVYEKFPTPLINRLEKHFVLMSSILTTEEKSIMEHLQLWIQNFSKVDARSASTLINILHVYRQEPRFVSPFSFHNSAHFRRGMHLLAIVRIPQQQLCFKPTTYFKILFTAKIWHPQNGY